MPRIRKTHVQQTFEFRRRGGKRKGAGRKPKGKRSSEPHKKRARIEARHPQHINTRVVEGFDSLRKRDMYRAIREATITVFRHEVDHGVGFRLVHASIQRTRSICSRSQLGCVPANSSASDGQTSTSTRHS